MKKSIVKISEGLGNQLFMYAHAYAFSKKLNYDLHVDSVSAYKKLKIRSFLLDNFKINLKYADSLDLRNNYYQYLKFKFNKKFDYFRSQKKFLIEFKDKHKLTEYRDYTKFKFRDNLYIEGYFESEKYFIDYKKDILEKFQINNIITKNLAVNPFEFQKYNSVSIVIRQHRFSEKLNSINNINKSNIFVKKTIDYINNATKLIESKIDNPKFYIFSNDVTNLYNSFDKNKFKFINHNKDKPINDFYLSTLCKHFIVGPSTFHWWSAYLSKYKNKLCICPTSDLKFSSNKDIYPDNWIKF